MVNYICPTFRQLNLQNLINFHVSDMNLFDCNCDQIRVLEFCDHLAFHNRHQLKKSLRIR